LTGLAKKDELSPKIMSRLVEEFDPTYKYLKSLDILDITAPNINMQSGNKEKGL
jgi:hypothetical protein